MTGRIGGYAFLCVLSGVVGAFSTRLLESNGQGSLQVSRLEIVDAQKNARAVLSVEDNGAVSLRLLSKDKKAIVTLASDFTSVGTSSSPYGVLSIADSSGRPKVELRTNARAEGSLTFSSPYLPDQVRVGYSPYGDFEDGHERGAWGIQIAGPEHSKTGLNVFSLDGVLQGATIPLDAPNSIKHR